MRYQSTTDLCEETIDEITCRVADVIKGGGMDLARCRIPLRDQVVACLLILRQNLPQMVVADLLGVSQPTISRTWRRITALLEAVLVFLPRGLPEAIQQGQLILIDGTRVPTGNRPASGQARHNYSGKRKLQCLNIQVASTDRGDLIAVSNPVPGSRHDSKALKLCGWQDLLDSSAATWIADTAYISTTASTPVKKAPSQPRDEWERKFSKTLASLRAPIEHCIARFKN